MRSTAECEIILFYTLENKGSKMGFSQQCHRRTIIGSPKNLSVKSEEPFSSIKDLLCIGKFPWMLKE
jgi:hypothetical protein